MAITYERQRMLLAGCNSIEAKVYEQVPVQEQWSVDQIYRHINARGITVDHRRFRGALGGLKERGLVQEVARDVFQRVAVKAAKTPVEKSEANPRLGDVVGIDIINALHAHSERTANKKIGSLEANTSGEISVQTPKDKMATTQKTLAASDALSALSDVATEMNAIATEFPKRLFALAKKLEEVALSVESEREENSEVLKKARVLQEALRTFNM